DISVVGFDDITMAQHTIPQLTTVRIQKREMGTMAAKRLLELLEEPDAKPIKVIVGVELVVRDSVAESKDKAAVQDMLLRSEAHAQ
ncbi:MAG: substrate-binding domain-containing protein, partial [Limnochordia bacterium]